MLIEDFQPLHEGRDAPLFHGTPLDMLLNILASDTLSVGINWRGEGDRVATSRDWRVAAQFGVQGDYSGYPTMLVLDQRKLSQRFKLKPYRDYDAEGNAWADEKEEMVMGDIKPLHRYLISINIEPHLLAEAIDDTDFHVWMAETWAESENSPFTTPETVEAALLALSRHPLLNRWEPKVGTYQVFD